MMVDKETIKHMDKFYSGGFLYNPETKEVLLHKRDGNTKFNPNKWAFFGGLNEGKETPAETFVREVKEELGILVKSEQVISLVDYLNEELGTHRYVFYVQSNLKKSEMHLGEGAGFDWISLDKVFDYDLTEKVARDLKLFLEMLPS